MPRLYQTALDRTAHVAARLGGPRAIGIAIASLGGGVGIGLMALLADWAHLALGLVPFATSIVLVLGSPEVAPAQPRNIVLGHLLSAISGALAIALVGPNVWAAALGVAVAMAAMHGTDSFHPPAGINPVVMMMGHAGWSFVVFPVALGAVLLVAYAWAYHSLTLGRRWPHRWW